MVWFVAPRAVAVQYSFEIVIAIVVVCVLFRYCILPYRRNPFQFSYHIVEIEKRGIFSRVATVSLGNLEEALYGGYAGQSISPMWCKSALI